MENHFKKGDMVWRLDENGKHKDDVPVAVITDEWILCGTPVVWLDGFSACHSTDMLEKA